MPTCPIETHCNDRFKAPFTKDGGTLEMPRPKVQESPESCMAFLRRLATSVQSPSPGSLPWQICPSLQKRSRSFHTRLNDDFHR
jgi:hypothetical protein